MRSAARPPPRWVPGPGPTAPVLPENVVRPNITRRDARTRDAARPGSADPRLGPRSGAVTVAAGRPEPTVRAPGAGARGWSARRTSRRRRSQVEGPSVGVDVTSGQKVGCAVSVDLGVVSARGSSRVKTGTIIAWVREILPRATPARPIRQSDRFQVLSLAWWWYARYLHRLTALAGARRGPRVAAVNRWLIST